MDTTDIVELELDRIAPPAEPVRFQHSTRTLLFARIAAGVLALPFGLMVLTGTGGIVGFLSLIVAVAGAALIVHVQRRIAVRPSAIVVSADGLSITGAGAPVQLRWAEVATFAHDRVRRRIAIGTRMLPYAAVFDDDLEDFPAFLDAVTGHIEVSRDTIDAARGAGARGVFIRPPHEDIATLALSLSGIVAGLMVTPVLFVITALALPRLLWHWLLAPSSVVVDDTAVWLVRPLSRVVIPLRAIDEVAFGVAGIPAGPAVLIEHRDNGAVVLTGFNRAAIPLFDAIVIARHRAREAARGMAAPARTSAAPRERTRSGRSVLVRAAAVLAAFLAVAWITVLTGLPLRSATRSGSDVMARAAILLGAPLDATDDQGRTALHDAALLNRVVIARSLIAGGADVNAATDGDRLTPLHQAAERGNHEIVGLLIGGGADVNARSASGSTPLSHAALGSGLTEIGRMLLDAGADPDLVDDAGRTAVHQAAANAHIDLLRQLARAGADLEAADTLGHRPLHVALLNRKQSAIARLVEGGASVNAPGRDGRTALAYAAGDAEMTAPIVNLLIDVGARADIADADGWNAVQLAAARNNLEVLQVLARRRVTLDATDGRVPPALWIAARDGHTDAARILLRGGASPRVRWEGTSAIELAHGKRNATLVALMQMR